MAEYYTTDKIAQVFKSAGDSIPVINSSKLDTETEDAWKERVKANVEHLELIKTYKKEDGTTSIWTTENFTDINAAITAGKAKYE